MILKRSFFYALCFCMFFVSGRLSGQINHGESFLYTERNGLSHVSVTAIHKAKDGYLWVGSIEGLNRFNGENFKSFFVDEIPERGITNNSIRAITEDRSGTIWIGTDRGLNKYNPLTESFEHIYFFGSQDKPSGYSFVISLETDGNILWVGTFEGLIRYNIRTKNYTKISLGEAYDNSKMYRDVLALCSYDTFLWVGTRQGLFKYNKNTGKTVNFSKYNFINTGQISGQRINHIRAEGNDLWLSTERGISKITQTGEHFRVENYEISAENQYTSDIRDFYYTAAINDSLMVTGTIISGLFTFSKTNEAFSHYQPRILEDVKTKTHFYDEDEKILWVGVLNKGLLKIVLGQQLFSPQMYYDRKDRLSSFFFFAEDKENSDIIWAGATTGLIRYNRKTQQFSIYYITFGNDVGYTIRAIADNGKGKLFLGTHDKGLYVFDKKTAEFNTHQFSASNPEYGMVHTLLLYRETLFIGAANILFLYNLADHSVQRYEINEHTGETLESLFLTENNRLLIGSLSEHISVFEINERKLTKISVKPNDMPTEHCNTSAMYFTPYKEHKILVSTYGSGICVYDIQENKVYKETALNPGQDVVYGILYDNAGGLWAASNYGLHYYASDSDSWVMFNKSDGLQGNEFNVGALLQTSDGELFFGGNIGFNHFYPESIKVQKQTVSLYFEDLKLHNRSIRANDTIDTQLILGQSIQHTDSLELSYKHNFISISFSAIDFKNPDDIHYRYILEGFNEDWIYTERSGNYAVFTNLNPGRYDFVVQASTKFSDFSDNEIRLHIYIKPPFWETPFFYILAMLLIVLSVITFIKIRERNLKYEKKKLEQLVDLRTTEIRAARNELKQEKEFADAIIEISPEGIAVFDSTGAFLRLNPALSKLLGYTATELIGSSIKDITPTEWNEQLSCNLEKINRGQTIVSETEMIRKDGSLVDIRISSASIAGSAFVSVITDISERKIAEYRAEQYRAELEKQVKERTEDYKIAKEKAENADKLKTAFLANMSHEIRTPLNAILGFSQLLNEKDISRDLIESYTGLIQRGGNSLLHLINDIIDLAKIESNQIAIKKEDFSVNELIDETYQMFHNSKEQLENTSVELRINLPAHDVVLYSDPNRVKQVLVNLLNNAHKFTEEGYIEVGYEHSIYEGKVFLKFYVKDTGTGISEDKLEKVFSRFTKFDEKSTRLLKGAGLGLAISKRIVNLLGGEIYVESEPGKGSNFYFTIPI